MVGCYGLDGGRVAVFAVHREPDPTLRVDPRRAVHQAYASLGWVVPQALRGCPEPASLYYDQVAQVVAPQWSRGRVVLVGDACQAVSLLAGQGASLAVAGAYVLGEQLAVQGSVEAALRGYQQAWAPVVAEKQAVVRRGVRWFLPDSMAQVRVRRVVLHLARLPVVERLVGSALVGSPKLAPVP